MKKMKKVKNHYFSIIYINRLFTVFAWPSIYEYQCKNRVYDDMEASLASVENANIRIIAVTGNEDEGVGYSASASGVIIDRVDDTYYASVSELLGAEEIAAEKNDDLVDQLARINEQLSIRNRRSRRIWKGILIAVIAFCIIIPLMVIIPGWILGTSGGADVGYRGSTEWVYSLDGKEYEYSVQYDEDYNIVSQSSNGDAQIDEELDLESCTDAYKAKARIESYFEDQGGELIHEEVKGLELKE